MNLAHTLKGAGQTLSRSYGRYFAEFLSEGSLIGHESTRLEHLCWFAVRIALPTRTSAFLASAFTEITVDEPQFSLTRPSDQAWTDAYHESASTNSP